MQSLPSSLVCHEILTLLEPKDQLSLALTCKPFYDGLFEREPEFKKRYGKKHAMGQCLYDMVRFVRAGEVNMAYWAFAYLWYHNIHSPNHPCLVLKKTGKNQTIHVHATKETWSVPKMMCFFEQHIWPQWDHIEMHTGCWYKSRERMREFHAITARVPPRSDLGRFGSLSMKFE